ncbi:MAG TPA: copper resistance CopC family protein [Blastocatellia bacterium]|nr:copper resistance CopC family protein [Blastocatellia bacterium]
MIPIRLLVRALAIVAVIHAACLLTKPFGLLHAILVECEPAANATVAGPNVTVKLRFNSRIDVERSRLTLSAPDGSTRKLKLEAPPSPDVLLSQVSGLSAGSYTVVWQVLAVDGHITRGQFSFKVS